MATTNGYFNYWLTYHSCFTIHQSIIMSIKKSQLKNAHFHFSFLVGKQSNLSGIQFTMIEVLKNQQIFTSEKLEPVFDFFHLLNDKHVL